MKLKKKLHVTVISEDRMTDNNEIIWKGCGGHRSQSLLRGYPGVCLVEAGSRKQQRQLVSRQRFEPCVFRTPVSSITDGATWHGA
jgi:hypothetical protein